MYLNRKLYQRINVCTNGSPTVVSTVYVCMLSAKVIVVKRFIVLSMHLAKYNGHSATNIFISYMILHKHQYHRSHLRSKDLGQGSSPCIRIKLLSPSPDGTCKQYSSVGKFTVPDWGK
jgi:hypothetical protein